ncbi:TPA: amino acid ABC transporter permease, partial [Streptococcus pneumoniae]
QILGGADYRYFERFISVALVYWVVNIGIESLGRFIERKMAISAPDTVQTDVKGDLR